MYYSIILSLSLLLHFLPAESPRLAMDQKGMKTKQVLHFKLTQRTFIKYCGGAPSLEPGTYTNPESVAGATVYFKKIEPLSGAWTGVDSFVTDQNGEVHASLALGDYCLKVNGFKLSSSNTKPMPLELRVPKDSLDIYWRREARKARCDLKFSLTAENEPNLSLESTYYQNCPWDNWDYNGPLPN